MPATRDRRRRRRPLAHNRGELLAHVQKTTSPYNLPAIGNNIADQANRDGVAARFADPAVHTRIAVDLALIDDDAQLLRDWERSRLTAAPHHDANTLYLLRTVPGIGTILRLVLWYELHDSDRFPRGQEFAASCRLVKGAKEAAGKRAGTTGPKIGPAHRQGACSDAAVFFLRDHPEGQKCLGTWAHKHGQGKAWTLFAQKLARAVYDMLQRKTAVNTHRFFTDSRRGVDELDASRDNQRLNRLLHALPSIKACVDERRWA